MTRAVEDLISEGREALQAGDSERARTAFGLARELRSSGSILDGLGQAAYINGEYDAAITQFESAYAAYREEGDHVGAIHMASKLGWLSAAYRGDGAVMQGWISRAQSLLGDEETLEHGWVEYYKGMFAPLGMEREAHLRAALESGRRFKDGDLEFVSLAQLGQGYVATDRIEEGMMLLDEALVAVVGGEASDFNIVEIIFCQLFAACEHANDVVRADQWIRVSEEIAKRRRLPAVAAWCRTHYGGILTAAGRWPEAEAELTEATKIWTKTFSTLRWSALVRLADLRVRQGRFEEAERLLDGLDVYAEATRPLAAIYLARGETVRAIDALERALGQMEQIGTQAAGLLALLVDAHLARGATDDADAAAVRLETIAKEQQIVHLRASAALARARVCVATGSGDPRAWLQEAMNGFAQAQLPMELASARLTLAQAVTEAHPEVAIAEASSALEAFERLQAARHADAAAALLRDLGGPARTGPKGNTTLTKREGEVLTLLGYGLSNPEISDRLFISRKTVEHHVGNVLAKLGVRSRAEAAAYAARMEDPAQK